jgi:hypothetical protein
LNAITEREDARITRELADVSADIQRTQLG